MNLKKTTTALFILLTQLVFGQNTTVENTLKKVDQIFGKFINDDRSGSAENIIVCNDFKKLIVDNKIDSVYILKKSIVELYAYCNLESQDNQLILTAPAEAKLFDLLIANLKKAVFSSDYDKYVFSVVGYYQENVQRNYLQAEIFYKNAFESGKPFPALLLWRSYNFFRCDSSLEAINRDSAKAWLAECIKQKPDYPSAYACLGHYAAWEGNFIKANSWFSECLRLDPDSKDGNNAFGFWFNRRKMYDSAIVYFEKIIQKYPHFIKAMTNLANSYQAKNTTYFYKKAIEIYKKCIITDSLEATYYDEIAKVYLNKLEEKDSALHFYKEEVRLNPSMVYKLGNFYYNNTDDYKKAVKYYNDYTKINPSATLYDLIGNCYAYMTADSTSHAIDAYKIAVNLDSNFAHSYDQLGFLYNSLLYYDSSIHYYNKLIRLNMPIEKRKGYISDMGFPYRNLANLKIKENYFTAYTILKEGAKNGNRGCRFMAFAMQNEFGYDDSEKDSVLAKKNYTEAAKLWPFSKLGIDGILRLYEKEKIPVGDSTDYKLWKKMDTAVLNSRYWKITTYQETSEKQFSIRLLKSYPPNVHPLEWERKRLKEDFGLQIKDEEYERVAKMYREAKDEGQSLLDYSVSSSDKKILADIDKLNKNYAEKKDEETMNTIKGKWEERLKLKTDDDEVKLNASEFYRVSSVAYFDTGNFDMALQMAERGLEIYASNRLLIRLQCKILIVLGKNQEAYLIYDKYRHKEYLADEEITYREVFLIDIPDIEKKYPSKAANIESAKLYLYSARDKLKKKLMNYSDVMSSKNPQTLFEAAMYFADSWNKDSLLLSFACYEKLLLLKDSTVFNDRYIEAIARYTGLKGSKNYKPFVKKLEALFASCSYSKLEKLLLKFRMRIIRDQAFNMDFDSELKKMAENNRYWDIMYSALMYKSAARIEKNLDTLYLAFTAIKAIDMYLYVKDKMAPTQKDYKEIINLIAKRCGEFSYSIIKLKEFDYGLKAALLATNTDPDEPYAKTNLPIAYVLTGDFERGKELYLEYKDKKFIDKRSFKEVFLEDIDDLKKNGVPIGRLEEIKTLLNQN